MSVTSYLRSFCTAIERWVTIIYRSFYQNNSKVIVMNCPLLKRTKRKPKKIVKRKNGEKTNSTYLRSTRFETLYPPSWQTAGHSRIHMSRPASESMNFDWQVRERVTWPPSSPWSTRLLLGRWGYDKKCWSYPVGFRVCCMGPREWLGTQWPAVTVPSADGYGMADVKGGRKEANQKGG